jgi:hypothetical protein
MEKMKAAIRRSLAMTSWIRTRDRVLLDQLGIDPATIKRPRGRTPKTHFTDKQIVQLVWKQKYQAGLPFSNDLGGDLNRCFVAVADAQGRNVGGIREAWKRVPAAERKQIGAWVLRLLREHGALHQRFSKKK